MIRDMSNLNPEIKDNLETARNPYPTPHSDIAQRGICERNFGQLTK